jgi:LDH2 family malate/lactate/ureidoglycolate dehydrogenase
MRVDGFRPVDEFKENMDRWIERFKSSETSEGQPEVIIPGEPEARIYDERVQAGLPLIDAVYNDLKVLCEELGVDFTI